MLAVCGGNRECRQAKLHMEVEGRLVIEEGSSKGQQQPFGLLCQSFMGRVTVIWEVPGRSPRGCGEDPVWTPGPYGWGSLAGEHHWP